MVVVLFFIAIGVVVFVPGFWYVHHARSDDGGGGGTSQIGARGGGRRTNCTTDETFDTGTQMCMMNVHFPQAVSAAIMDTSTPACTDAFRHLCGKWIDEHTNENRGFTGLAMRNGAMVRDIVLDSKVANLNPFYESCVNTLVNPQASGARRKRHMDDTHLTQLAILGRMLDPLVKLSDLPIVFGRMAAAGYTVPVSLVIQNHPKDTGLIPMLTYDGFSGMEQDVEWVRMHFALIYGEEDARTDKAAIQLIDTVTKLNMMRPDKDGDMETYEGWKDYVQPGGQFEHDDLMTWSAFTRDVCPRFDWTLFLKEVSARLSLPELQFTPTQKVWAFSKRYFQWFDPSAFSMEEWKNYITFSVLYHTHDFFPEIPSDVLLRKPVNVHSQLRLPHRRLKKTRLAPGPYGYRRMAAARVVSRSQARSRRWHKTASRRPDSQHRRVHDIPSPRYYEEEDDGIVITAEDCVMATKYMLPGILSREFLNRAFGTRTETVRARVSRMVEAIRDRFVKNLNATTWLDAVTRAAQVEKVKAIIPRVVHPTEWMEEKFDVGREMDPVRYLRNLGIIQEDRVRRNLVLWSQSHFGANCDDKCRDLVTFFGAPLFTVNAWYNPDRNLITIPAGILQPPFYHDQYTDASAYGTIGWVIGHELSHGEDSNGILYDKNGIMNNTWSAEAVAEYRRRAQCIVREYGSPEGCGNDNYGEQTLSEDTADINGIRLAYEALFIDNPPKGVDLAVSKREFFQAAGQMWCASYAPQVLCDNSREDVHAVASMRVKKTFAHLPYYADAFGCAPGTAMHRHNCERCVFFGDDAKAQCAAR